MCVIFRSPKKKRKSRKSVNNNDDPDFRVNIKMNDIDPDSSEGIIIKIEKTRKSKKSRKKGDKSPKKSHKEKKERRHHPPPIELDEPIECDVCNQTYKNNVAFAIHSIEHSLDHRYSCHLCDFKNISKYHMEMHIRAHEGTTKYKCEICDKAFTVSTNAIEHKYFHTGEKPFQCEICGKHFMYSRFLASHRRTQHWEIMTGTPLVKYDCKICNKHYTSSSGLKRHNLRNHNTEGIDTSVLCDTCGKRISSKEKLKFHMRIHTGYKPFACEVCGKAFTEKERLKEHMRVHTGEKPFVCKYCGKSFTQRSPLKIHERTHTGEQPYICRLCGRGFVSKSAMDAHMKSCSALQVPSANRSALDMTSSNAHSHQLMAGLEVIPHVCRVCNKIFGTKGALEAHMVSHSIYTAPYSMVSSPAHSYVYQSDADTEVKTEEPHHQLRNEFEEMLERRQFAASLNELMINARKESLARRSESEMAVKPETLPEYQDDSYHAQDFTQKRTYFPHGEVDDRGGYPDKYADLIDDFGKYRRNNLSEDIDIDEEFKYFDIKSEDQQNVNDKTEKPRPKKIRKAGTKNKIIKVGTKKVPNPAKQKRIKSEKLKVRRMRSHPPPVELDEPIECEICNATYKNNVAFALHTIRHSLDNKYSCHLCPYKNISKYHIEMHVRAHEGTTRYKCEICQKAFTVSTHATEHKFFHTGEKPFQCEICGKHFMFSRFLAAHRRSQHYEILTGSPLVKFDCKVCNKHYASASGLRRHKLSKHNDEGIDLSVLCDICGKRLSSREKLKFHRRIHTGYKPFACQVCSKAFTKKDQLTEHVRVHTGEKPHICKYCGRGFTQRTPLKIHERTHSGERPYVCACCGKGFVTKTSVDSHMKSCGGNVVSAFAQTWMGHPFPQLSQQLSQLPLAQIGQIGQLGQPSKYFTL